MVVHLAKVHHGHPTSRASGTPHCPSGPRAQAEPKVSRTPSDPCFPSLPALPAALQNDDMVKSEKGEACWVKPLLFPRVQEACPHSPGSKKTGHTPITPPIPDHRQVPDLTLTSVGQSPLFLNREMAAEHTWRSFHLEAEAQPNVRLVRVLDASTQNGLRKR